MRSIGRIGGKSDYRGKDLNVHLVAETNLNEGHLVAETNINVGTFSVPSRVTYSEIISK